MGHFYTNATIWRQDEYDVVLAVARMGRACVVAKGHRDLTVLFDQQSERQDGNAYPFLA
jgi:hypothetical protein